MTDVTDTKTFTQLPAAAALTGGEVLAAVQSGTAVQLTLTQALAQGGLSSQVAANTSAIAALTSTVSGLTPPISGLTYQQIVTQYPVGSANAPTGTAAFTTNAGRVVMTTSGWETGGDWRVGQTAIPWVYMPSSTVGNNGAVTVGTAISLQGGNFPAFGYAYFPAGALYSGSFAASYWFTMSSTTAMTVYNNIYAGGQPVYQSNPTPIVATGPGAFTAVTGTGIFGYGWSVPGNALGPSGRARVEADWSNNNSAGTKQFSKIFGSPNMTGAGTDQETTTIGHSTIHSITNRGVVNKQVSAFNSNGQTGPSSSGMNYPAYDTSKGFIIGFTGQIATATDFIVMESFSITVQPSGLLDFPTPYIIIPTGATIVPPGAAALGLNRNAFYTQPQAQDVSGWSSGTFNNNAGANLYAGLYYKSQPAYATSIITNTTLFGRNVLTINYDGAATNYQIATQTQNSTQGAFPYLNSNNAFYVQFGGMQVGYNPDNFPAMGWLLPQSHTNSSTANWFELDVDEGGLVQRSGVPFLGSLNSALYWVYPSTVTTHNNSQSGTDWGMNIDRTQPNLFGMSWNPTSSSTGVLQYWLNGAPTWSYSPTSTEVGIILNQSYYLIVSAQTRGQNVPYKQYILSMEAWTA